MILPICTFGPVILVSLDYLKDCFEDYLKDSIVLAAIGFDWLGQDCIDCHLIGLDRCSFGTSRLRKALGNSAQAFSMGADWIGCYMLFSHLG